MKTWNFDWKFGTGNLAADLRVLRYNDFMGKKRKIFILSALAAGIAIFFGRKRMKSKSEESAHEGDWTPDDHASHDADHDAAHAEEAEHSDHSAEEAEEEATEKAS